MVCICVCTRARVGVYTAWRAWLSFLRSGAWFLRGREDGEIYKFLPESEGGFV